MRAMLAAWNDDGVVRFTLHCTPVIVIFPAFTLPENEKATPRYPLVFRDGLVHEYPLFGRQNCDEEGFVMVKRSAKAMMITSIAQP